MDSPLAEGDFTASIVCDNGVSPSPSSVSIPSGSMSYYNFTFTPTSPGTVTCKLADIVAPFDWFRLNGIQYATTIGTSFTIGNKRLTLTPQLGPNLNNTYFNLTNPIVLYISPSQPITIPFELTLACMIGSMSLPSASQSINFTTGATATQSFTFMPPVASELNYTNNALVECRLTPAGTGASEVMPLPSITFNMLFPSLPSDSSSSTGTSTGTGTGTGDGDGDGVSSSSTGNCPTCASIINSQPSIILFVLLAIGAIGINNNNNNNYYYIKQRY